MIKIWGGGGGGESAYNKLFFCLEIFQYELWLKE